MNENKYQNLYCMKKVLLLVIVGWMSIMTVSAQITAFHGGYAFKIDGKVYPNRTNFAIDFYEGHGYFGIGTAFPSNYDPRFEINTHGGVIFCWDNFWLAPNVEIAYNHRKYSEEVASHKTSSGVSIGAGLIANYRIVGPLGVFTKIRWMSPVEFEPVSFGPGGTTSFAIGLSMLWFH